MTTKTHRSRPRPSPTTRKSRGAPASIAANVTLCGECAEVTLRRTEARLRLTLDTAHAATWDWDLRSGKDVWSDHMYTMLGYRPGECPSSYDAWARRVHPDDLGRVTAALLGAVAKCAEYRAEYRVVWPDGACHWVEARGRCEYDAQGVAVRMLGVLIDVDARRKARAALRRRKSQLKTLADTTPDIVVRLDRHMRHLYVNRAVEIVTGRAAEEFIGRTGREMGMPDDLCSLWEQKVASIFATGKSQHFEFDFPSRDGLRHFEARLAPELDRRGRVEYVMSVSRDMTASRQSTDQLRRACEQAETANRAKDEFLATLSHELRTPLGAMLIWAKLLKQGTLAPHERTAAIDTLVRCAHDQSRLVNDLLDASGIQHGKLTADMRPLDLAAVVDAAVTAIRPTALAKAVEITPHLRHAPIVGDAARLQQVVFNLLSNAIKFSPTRGRVSVHVTSTPCANGGGGQIRVTDAGEGISAEFLPHVFERFRQADNSITRRHGGLGLGLFIVHSIVKLHGGSVRAQSAGLGHGATFTVTLPRPPTS